MSAVRPIIFLDIVAAHLMGHGSTKMVELVYARIDQTTKNKAMALLGDVSFAALGTPELPQDFHKTSAHSGRSGRF